MSVTAKKTESGAAKNGSPRLSSVTTAIRLLKEFSEEDVELGISTLSRNLGVAKSTVHRVASTLVAEGLLEQDSETELYRLGLGLFSLGALVRQRLSVTSVAKEMLTDLRDEFRENVELAVIKGDQVTYVYDFESPRPVRLRSRLGVSQPIVDCAIGMAIAAYQAKPTQKKLVKKSERATSETDTKEIWAELEEIKLNGFAAETENVELGAVCVAAPVFNANGTVTSAIGITVPHQRVKAQTIDMLAQRLVKTAEEISRKLGYVEDKANLYT